MSETLAPIRNKHQARTLDTQARILDAAQALFAEQGFEKTQLDEVAARAGYTRGAIYAHYSSKEDLFFALLEQRVHTKFLTICQSIREEPEMSKRRAIFKHWITSQVCDPSWGTLMLEFKLYALRRPTSREKLKRLHDLMFQSMGKDFVDLLFGKSLAKNVRSAVERRMAVMGAVLSAVVLESQYRPELLSSKHLQAAIEELFDALVHA